MKLNFSVLKQLLLLRFIILINRYFAHFILLYEIDGSSLTFYVRRRFVYSFSTLLKYHFFSRCQQVSEMLCVDNPSLPNRFELVYVFTSYAYSTRMLMRTFTTPGLNAMTLTPLFAVLNWQEREVWDMFGVAFFGHPDLRRILTDYGFLGHPLRKDFPLSGFVEVYFDDTAQLVCYQPLSLAQEFRDFSQGLNPWLEGAAS